MFFLAKNVPGLRNKLVEINYQVPLYTESQNSLGWRVPLEVIWSNCAAEAQVHRAGCPIPCPGNIPEKRYHDFSGHPVPMLCRLHSTEVIPDSQVENIILRVMFSWNCQRNGYLTDVRQTFFIALNF